MEETGPYPVKVYIYDLSRGMARQLSPLMLGEFGLVTCWLTSWTPQTGRPGPQETAGKAGDATRAWAGTLLLV